MKSNQPMKTTHACPHCDGKGRIELTGVYAETLKKARALLVADAAYLIANRDAWQFGCNPTALNNRMARLEKLGYLKSERFGRERRFTVR